MKTERSILKSCMNRWISLIYLTSQSLTKYRWAFWSIFVQSSTRRITRLIDISSMKSLTSRSRAEILTTSGMNMRISMSLAMIIKSGRKTSWTDFPVVLRELWLKRKVLLIQQMKVLLKKSIIPWTRSYKAFQTYYSSIIYKEPTKHSRTQSTVTTKKNKSK